MKEQKTVLLINTHLTYPNWTEGKLNNSFFEIAKHFFKTKNYEVLETKVEEGYNADEEVEKHLKADIVILQTPVNCSVRHGFIKNMQMKFLIADCIAKSFFREMGEHEKI